MLVYMFVALTTLMSEISNAMTCVPRDSYRILVPSIRDFQREHFPQGIAMQG